MTTHNPPASLPTQTPSPTTADRYLLPALAPKEERMLSFGTARDFGLRFAPANVGKCGLNPTASIVNKEAPTLFLMDRSYGQTVTTQWIMFFLVDLSEYSGLKNRITERQLTRLAEVLHQRFMHLKASEVMLFFSKLQSGEYGRIGYSTFDPFSITESIKSFLRYRSEIIYEHDSRRRDEQDRLDRERAVPCPPHIAEHLKALYSEHPSTRD